MTIEDQSRLYGEEPEEEEENEEGDDEDDDDEEEEEDLIDPIEEVRDVCGGSSGCKNYRAELEVCNDRVNSRSNTEEHCTQELFDFLHCTDKCVAQSIFQKLK